MDRKHHGVHACTRYCARTSIPVALVLALACVALGNRCQASPPGNQNPSDPLQQLDLEQLANVEVTTVSKEPEQIWQTPAAIYVLTQEDIRRSGATSIPEVLRLVPGVEVARIDSNTWAVGIRGFGSGFSRSVLVLIDGRSVYTPLYAGVYWSVQNVMLPDIERIEVIRGPGGTIWGANAVNGVINIITKKSEDTQGALVSLGGGNLDQGMGGFRYGGSFGDDIDYRVYGFAFANGPEFHPGGDNFDTWQLGQGGFRVDWDNHRHDTVSLEGELYKGATGQLATISSTTPPSTANAQGVQNVSGAHILTRWEHKLGDGSDIQLQGYYDRTYRVGLQIGEVRDTFDLDFIHHITYLPRQDIIWGLGSRWSPSNIIQTAPTINFLPESKSDNIYSLFAQDQVALVQNKLWATLGTKFEHNVYSGWEVQPSARLLWTPTPHQTVWAAVTRAVRTPSRLDTDLQLSQYVPDYVLPVFLKVLGDPNFQPETLLSYEAGYRKLLTPRFYADLSLFYNQYNDLSSFGAETLSFDTSAVTPTLLLTLPYANGIKGSTKGGEIATTWKVANWLDLKTSYSYLDMNLEDKPGYTDTATLAADEGSSPRHEATIQALINLPKGFEVDPTYRYVSELWALGVPAYGTMDVRFGWHVGRNVEFSLDGQNLFQPHHPEFSGDPGALIGIKRSAYVQMTWRR